MTMAEIQAILEASDSDDEDVIIRNNARSVVYIPPPVDELSDEEILDDNIISGNSVDAMQEIAGEVEIEFHTEFDEVSSQSQREDLQLPEPSTVEKYTSKDAFPKSKWVKQKPQNYRNTHDATELIDVQKELVDMLGIRVTLFLLYFLYFKCIFRSKICC